MTNLYKNDLKKIITEISKKENVAAIFLFGSQINGRARKDSDIDIAVLTKTSTNEQDLEILSYSSEKIDISLFFRLPLINKFRVLKEGKLLFCRDEHYLSKIKFETFKNYLDYAPFINNFYRRVIKNV